MKSFFVTFGKGILYFIGLPFIVLFLVLYGIYLLGVFFFMLCRTVVLFFEGKPTGIKDAMDEKAMLILRERKAQAIQDQAAQLQPVTQNNINQTINNYNIGAVPPNMNQQQVPLQHELPPVDTTMQRVAPISDIEEEPQQLPVYNNNAEENK